MSFPGFSKESTQQRKKNIFINYRVHDTAGETGRLVDRLKQHFSKDQIFMDIDRIEPGVDFTKAISKSLDSCDVMLAIIGPHWLGKDGNGDSSRIKNPNDWVKLEITTALQRDVRVVPVLVDGAELPSAEELPPELQPLLLRQSYEISNKRWDYDTAQLVNFLVKLGITPKTQTQDPVVPQQKTWWQRNSWWFFILLGVIITIGILVNIADKKDDDVLQRDNFTTESPVNNGKAEPQKTVEEPQQNVGRVSPPVNNSVANVDGTWIENDGGIIYTYDIAQEGNKLNIDVYLAGQYVSSGTGSVHGNVVEIFLNMNGISTAGKGTLTQNGSVISGSYTLQNTGQVGYFTLVKQ